MIRPEISTQKFPFGHLFFFHPVVALQYKAHEIFTPALFDILLFWLPLPLRTILNALLFHNKVRRVSVIRFAAPVLLLPALFPNC